MAKEKIENLITTLHETFGDNELSSQQAQLMEDMKTHLHNWDDPEIADPSLKETVELLLSGIENKHPKAATIIKEIIETLNNIGV